MDFFALPSSHIPEAVTDQETQPVTCDAPRSGGKEAPVELDADAPDADARDADAPDADAPDADAPDADARDADARDADARDADAPDADAPDADVAASPDADAHATGDAVDGKGANGRQDRNTVITAATLDEAPSDADDKSIDVALPHDDQNHEDVEDRDPEADVEVELRMPAKHNPANEQVHVLVNENTAKDLKNMCKKYGLNASGKKNELAARILEHRQSHGEADALVIVD